MPLGCAGAAPYHPRRLARQRGAGRDVLPRRCDRAGADARRLSGGRLVLRPQRVRDRRRLSRRFRQTGGDRLSQAAVRPALPNLRGRDRRRDRRRGDHRAEPGRDVGHRPDRRRAADPAVAGRGLSVSDLSPGVVAVLRMGRKPRHGVYRAVVRTGLRGPDPDRFGGHCAGNRVPRPADFARRHLARVRRRSGAGGVFIHAGHRPPAFPPPPPRNSTRRAGRSPYPWRCSCYSDWTLRIACGSIWYASLRCSRR